jgi:hypothetical protein
MDDPECHKCPRNALLASKRGGRFIAEAVYRPGLITDLRLERLALLGSLAGLTKVFEFFFTASLRRRGHFLLPWSICVHFTRILTPAQDLLREASVRLSRDLDPETEWK